MIRQNLRFQLYFKKLRAILRGGSRPFGPGRRFNPGHRFSFLPIFSCCLLLLGGCASGSFPSPGQTAASTSSDSSALLRTGFYFDTVIAISLYDRKDPAILDACMQKCAHYEDLLSAQKKNSDVWNINHSAPQAVKVSPETLALAKTALHYAKLSEGAFDPTIGRLSDLWNFTGDPPGPVPDPKQLKELASHVGFEKLKIDEDASTIALTDKEAALDLGGIAKGFIADELKTYLLAQGVHSAIINLGGNVLLVGGKTISASSSANASSAAGSSFPNRPSASVSAGASSATLSDFAVGIQEPFGATGDFAAVVEAQDKSIVSSGTYERYFKNGDKLYHHLLNPKTGYPVQNGLSGVTIVSDRSVDGDALSTTCFILGEKKGLQLINSLPDTEVMFIHTDGSLSYSKNFPRAHS